MPKSCVRTEMRRSRTWVRISLVFLLVSAPAAASDEHVCSSGAKVSWMHIPIWSSHRRRYAFFLMPTSATAHARRQPSQAPCRRMVSNTAAMLLVGGFFEGAIEPGYCCNTTGQTTT